MPTHAPIPLDLPNLSVRWLHGGRTWLDGGSAFGIIPRAMWARRCPPDESHRVPFDCNCLLVQTSDHLVLIDTGHGSNVPAKQRHHENLAPGHPLLESLAAAGVAPDQIDRVLLTHLHYDHAGGATLRGPDGQLRPTFPRARYLIQAAEWHDATANLPELKGAYPPDNILPLGEAGVVDLIDGDAEVVPGISVRRTGGHTRGHQAVFLGHGDQQALCPGDICPTSAHLSIFWILAYDQYLLETRRIKPRLLGEACDRAWPILFSHDPKLRAATLQRHPREDFTIAQTIA